METILNWWKWKYIFIPNLAERWSLSIERQQEKEKKNDTTIIFPLFFFSSADISNSCFSDSQSGIFFSLWLWSPKRDMDCALDGKEGRKEWNNNRIMITKIASKSVTEMIVIPFVCSKTTNSFAKTKRFFLSNFPFFLCSQVSHRSGR